MLLRKRLLCVLLLLICIVPCISLNALAAIEVSGEKGEVRVPIVLSVPHAIAGAEFEFTYTSGLRFVAFEKSETVRSASTTPVVEKNGNTYFGFYHGSNDFVPENGVLDVGYLIFEYSGEPKQSLTVTEAKYVQVVDKATTNSKIITINEEIGVPLSSGKSLQIGEKSYTGLIILAGVVVVAVIGGIFLYKYKKKRKV